MREALLFCFNLKKSAAESHWMLVEAYGDNALSETTCRDWFCRFNDDLMSVKKRENRPRKVEDCQLQDSFGRGRYPIAKNACWAIGCFSSSHFHAATCHEEGSKENGCRMNWTIGRWSDAKTCQILLARQKRKSFLHRIVTGEKWIYFQNPKRKKSWIDPAQPSTSSSRPNRFGRKTMLCVWWDQEGVIYYELLKPSETVNAHRYQQLIKLHHALREKRPHYWKRYDKLIFLHDNAPSHTSTMVQNLEILNWEVLPHPAYSPDLAPSDYHLFSSIGHALAKRHFDFYDVRKWLDEWFASKDEEFFWYTQIAWKMGKIVSEGKYFE